MNRYLIVFTIFLATALCWADEEINEDPLSARITSELGDVPQGANKEFIVEMDLAEPYHAYSDKFKLIVTSPEDFHVTITEIKPLIKFKDVFSKQLRTGLEKKGRLHAVLEVPSKFPIGPKDLKVDLVYQACTNKHCLFPKTIHLNSALTVTSYEQTAPVSESLMPKDLQSALEKGLFFAFLFVFFFGFLTSLTPCIYPMIPITLSVLGTRTKGQSKLKSFVLSLLYVFGIAFTYAILGVVAAKTGLLFGAVLSNPWIVSAIAILFVVLGLSMYGFFEIQAPSFLRQSLGTQKIGPGYLGAFVTGLVAGIVAGPCVGPVLVSVLTYIAKTQNVFLGFWLLFIFALGMGAPFIVLGTFTSILNHLPKAGSWMDGTKILFGSLMIGAAIYLVSPLISDRTEHVLIAIALISVSSYFGAFRSGGTLTMTQQFAKGWLLAAFLIGVGFAWLAILPPKENTTSLSQPVQKLPWQPYSDAKLLDAKKTRKPVIIDFYADWCGACKELEQYTFVDPRIQQQSQEFILLRIDATNESSLLSELKNRYHVIGLPTMIFLSRNGDWLTEITLTGFEDADSFLSRMKSSYASQ